MFSSACSETVFASTGSRPVIGSKPIVVFAVRQAGIPGAAAAKPQPAAAAQSRRLHAGRRPACAASTGAGTPARYGPAVPRRPPSRRRSVRADGTSAWISHTQIGARIGSNVPSSAVKAAGISRAPVVKQGEAGAQIDRAEREQPAPCRRAVTARPAAWVSANSPATTVPKQVAGVMPDMREAARDDGGDRRTATAISSASPSPTGETLPLKESETMMATPQMTAAIARPGGRRDPFAKQQEGDQRGDQRHPGLHQQDVGDGRVGERHDEGRGGGGEAQPRPRCPAGPCRETAARCRGRRRAEA